MGAALAGKHKTTSGRTEFTDVGFAQGGAGAPAQTFVSIWRPLMNRQPATLIGTHADDNGLLQAVRTPFEVSKAVMRGIGRWCSAHPKLKSHMSADASSESAKERAARIRRAQELVDALFARPDPKEASAVRFWDIGA